MYTEITVKNLNDSTDSREFLDGSWRTSKKLNTCVVGLGTYKPGWRWSLHAAPQTGQSSANHIGYVISGKFMVQDADGLEKEVGPGEAFEVGPGHDAWVIGSEPCVALDFANLSG